MPHTHHCKKHAHYKNCHEDCEIIIENKQGPTGPTGPQGATGTFECAKSVTELNDCDLILIQRQQVNEKDGFIDQFAPNKWTFVPEILGGFDGNTASFNFDDNTKLTLHITHTDADYVYCELNTATTLQCDSIISFDWTYETKGDSDVSEFFYCVINTNQIVDLVLENNYPVQSGSTKIEISAGQLNFAIVLWNLNYPNEITTAVITNFKIKSCDCSKCEVVKIKQRYLQPCSIKNATGDDTLVSVCSQGIIRGIADQYELLTNSSPASADPFALFANPDGVNLQYFNTQTGIFRAGNFSPFNLFNNDDYTTAFGYHTRPVGQGSLAFGLADYGGAIETGTFAYGSLAHGCAFNDNSIITSGVYNCQNYGDHAGGYARHGGIIQVAGEQFGHVNGSFVHGIASTGESHEVWADGSANFGRNNTIKSHDNIGASDALYSFAMGNNAWAYMRGSMAHSSLATPKGNKQYLRIVTKGSDSTSDTQSFVTEDNKLLTFPFDAGTAIVTADIVGTSGASAKIVFTVSKSGGTYTFDDIVLIPLYNLNGAITIFTKVVCSSGFNLNITTNKIQQLIATFKITMISI